MRRSGSIDFFIGEMNAAVQELHSSLTQPTLPPANVQLTEALPLITVASLLIEISKRVEGVAVAVDKLATAAGFKDANEDKKPGKADELAESTKAVQLQQV